MDGYKCANEEDMCYCNGIVKYGKPPKFSGKAIDVAINIKCTEREFTDGSTNRLESVAKNIAECWCIPNSKFEVLTVLQFRII